MSNVNKIKQGLISKILNIENKNFLEALDILISSKYSESQIIELTEEQKTMLEMSEEDIKNDRFISQDAMEKRNLEWLNAI